MQSAHTPEASTGLDRAPAVGPARPNLRVLVLATHYGDYSVRFCEALAKRATTRLIIERGCLAPEATPDLLATAAQFATQIDAVKAKGRVARALGTLQALWTMLAFRPHVIHAQEHPTRVSSWLIRMAARIAPVVLVVHDPEPHSGRDGDHARSVGQLTQAERAVASAFVVHGAYCRARLLQAEAVGQRPVVSIAHGAIMEPRGLPQHPPTSGRILMFGRMEAYKGLDLLLEAGRRMRAAGVNFSLALAGRGPELARLRTAFEGEGAEIIEQYLTPEEAIAQFQKASIVVAPYRDATQSGVVAAAFANGRPVVATRVGGLPDLVEDGVSGMLVEPASAEALAEALTLLVGGSDLQRRLAEGARNSSAGEAGWDRSAEACLDLYAALLSTGRRRDPT